MFNFVAFLAWIVSLSVWIGMMFCSAKTSFARYIIIGSDQSKPCPLWV